MRKAAVNLALVVLLMATGCQRSSRSEDRGNSGGGRTPAAEAGSEIAGETSGGSGTSLPSSAGSGATSVPTGSPSPSPASPGPSGQVVAPATPSSFVYGVVDEKGRRRRSTARVSAEGSRKSFFLDDRAQQQTHTVESSGRAEMLLVEVEATPTGDWRETCAYSAPLEQRRLVAGTWSSSATCDVVVMSRGEEFRGRRTVTVRGTATPRPPATVLGRTTELVSIRREMVIVAEGAHAGKVTRVIDEVYAPQWMTRVEGTVETAVEAPGEDVYERSDTWTLLEAA